MTSTSSPRFTRLPKGAFLPIIILPTVAFILSFVMAWATVGFTDLFLARWLRGFLTTVVVLPFVLVSLGLLEKQVDKVIGGLHWAFRKVVTAAITAGIIETVISFSVTATSHPFDATFTGTWWLAFSRSIPAGLAIGLFMSFYLKPKLDRMQQAGRSLQAA